MFAPHGKTPVSPKLRLSVFVRARIGCRLNESQSCSENMAHYRAEHDRRDDDAARLRVAFIGCR